jgi:acetyltransferase-like isoleucine patch superfamily enzyme
MHLLLASAWPDADMCGFCSLLANLFHLCAKVKSKWYGWRFLHLDRIKHSAFEIGSELSFNVPVRGGGTGRIRVGERNCFGCRDGYRLGSGEISLYTANAQAQISIGKGNFFNSNVSIGAAERVAIGDDCLIGTSVSIADCDFHDVNPETRRTSQGAKMPVRIGNNVWLGSSVAVLKGVTIGDNTVVGAMSVVTKSIPANCVAAGNPARILRQLGTGKGEACHIP